MATPTADRCALIAIRPCYADAILNYSKLVEFRKRVLAGNVQHIVIYTTSPVQLIVGTFKVAGVHRGTPSELWTDLGEIGGIEKSAYDSYFQGSSSAFGLLVEVARRLPKPVPLAVLGENVAVPQGFY